MVVSAVIPRLVDPPLGPGLSTGFPPVEENLVSAQFAADVVNNNTNQREYRISTNSSITIGSTTYQACVYWKTSAKLVIGIKTTAQALNAWTFYIYDGTGGLPDITNLGATDHDVVCLGIDKNGYIHVVYSQNNRALNYRKSSNPINTFGGTVSDTLSMLGTNETSVAYAEFINDPSGNLYFLFRAGNASNGDIYMYAYDETTGWAAATGTGTAGLLIDNTAAENCAYYYTPCFDKNFPISGYMHIAWHWRNDGADGNSNHDIGYAKWNGTSWYQSDGSAQVIPITPANNEEAVTIDEGNGLGGHGIQIASDASGRPHIVYPANDGSGYVQVYHTYFNGSAWTTPAAITSQAVISSTGDPPPGEPGWTPPAIAINQTTGAAHILYTGFNNAGITFNKSTDYSSWSFKNIWATTTVLWCITWDPIRWRTSKILSIPIFRYGGGANKGYLLEYTPVQP